MCQRERRAFFAHETGLLVPERRKNRELRGGHGPLREAEPQNRRAARSARGRHARRCTKVRRHAHGRPPSLASARDMRALSRALCAPSLWPRLPVRHTRPRLPTISPAKGNPPPRNMPAQPSKRKPRLRSEDGAFPNADRPLAVLLSAIPRRPR